MQTHMARPGACTLFPSSPTLPLSSPSRPVSQLSRASLSKPSPHSSLRSSGLTVTHTVAHTVTHTVTHMAYRGRGAVTRTRGSSLAPRIQSGTTQRNGDGKRADLKCFAVARVSGFCEHSHGASGAGEASLVDMSAETREQCNSSALLPSLLLALAAAPEIWPGTVRPCVIVCVFGCSKKMKEDEDTTRSECTPMKNAHSGHGLEVETV